MSFFEFCFNCFRPLPPEPFQEPWDDIEDVTDEEHEDVEVEEKSIAEISQVQIFNLNGVHILDQVNFVRILNNLVINFEKVAACLGRL